MREMAKSIITEREYSAISRELAGLKKQKKDLNGKLNDPTYSRNFTLVAEYEQWRHQTAQALEENKQRTEYLKILAHTYLGVAKACNQDAGIHEKRKQRDQSFLTPGGIVQLLIDARICIEELTEQNDDIWREGDKEVCGNLRSLERRIRGDRELNGWLSPQEAAGLIDRRNSHADEIERSHRKKVADLERIISDLQGEIRRMRSIKGRAANVLDRIYAGRYQEIDDFRRARGVTHRIHLTADDCKAIEDAIDGC